MYHELLILTRFFKEIPNIPVIYINKIEEI